MANELTLTASLRAQKNNVAVVPLVTSKTQTMESTLTHMLLSVQAVGTSVEAVATGDVDVTKQYMVLLFNRDATNYVSVSVYDGTNTIVAGIMLPGEPWGPVRMPAQSGGFPVLRMTANTAACNVECLVSEAGNPSA